MCQTSRYINLFTDFGFKKIFGDQENTDLLKSLLNDILQFGDSRKIKNIIFKNGELLPDTPEDRKAIIDLMCEDEQGNQFIVELQKVSQEHFQSRALYYTTFPIQQQGIKGGWNFELAPVYFIGLLNFEIDRFKHRPEYLHHGKITDIYSQEVMYDNLNMIYLEIPKLKKSKEELSSHLEWWMYIFQNLHNMTDIPEEMESDIIKDTFSKAEFASMPKGEQENYHRNLKVYRDLVNSFDFATKEGMEMGHKKGLKEGHKEGLKKGEHKKSIEVAKLSMAQGLDNKTISTISGLSIAEIEGLR